MIYQGRITHDMEEFMTIREKVYKAIDNERRYQDERWNGEFDDKQWSIADWLIFIERYVQKVKDNIGYDKEALANIRKIAALAVACMEYKGIVEREE